MMSYRRKSLTALVALACAVAQLATSDATIAGGLAFGHGDDGHTHAVSVQADAGHFDIVLTHDHSDEEPLAGAWQAPAHSSSCSEPDHVVHLGDEAPSCRNSKPPQPDAAPLSPVPFELRFGEPPTRSRFCVSKPRSFAVNLLRTVVLRL
jgi:hypothetical protein